MSLAGQDMAERRKYALSQQHFNVLLGPVGLRFNTSLGLEATDNVYLRDNDRQADLIIRPQFNMFSAWRVTEKNTLTLGLGVGYAKYLNATEYDSLLISPDTDLSFDLYVGDFVINFHDRFDYSQDVSSDPTVSDTGGLSRFENTAGVLVTWDLNKAVLTFGYDHRNFIATEPQDDRLTHSAELFTVSAGLKLRPTILTGLELGGGLIDYGIPSSNNQLPLQDNQHIAIGPFLSSQLSEYTTLRLSGGYVIYDVDPYPASLTSQPGFGYLTNVPSQIDAFYAYVSLRQRAGNLVSHTFSFGRSLQIGLASDLVDVWRVQDTANWNLLRKTSVATTVSYEHARTSAVSSTGETLDRYGFGITLGRRLTEKMSGTLGYQFYLKNSDLANSDYLQNRLVLNLVYTF